MSAQDFYKQTTLHASQPIAAPDSLMPKSIGPYKIEALLDKGGSSVLYLGTHVENHKPLAIKVLSPQFVSSPEMTESFLKEAKIIGMTSHPNIVQLYGEGAWEGGLYIAMEFVQGISLRQLILQNSLSLPRALEISLQIAYAIAHLHVHGVIHRDLKPENILLTSTGGIKVIDFGIAQLHTDVNEHAGKRLIGTPVYMSPEVRENPAQVSFQADIYALGIITYELVLGKISHGSIYLSLMPRGLQKILSKALQPKPQDRYADIVDFIKEVSAYLKSDELEKDLAGKDYASHIAEELSLMYAKFLPQEMPAWPALDIGFTRSATYNKELQYFDFFALNNSFAVVIAEPLQEGVKAMLDTAILKGMVAAIKDMLPDLEKACSRLAHLLELSGATTTFSFCLLVMSQPTNQLSYISYGMAPLWVISSGSEEPKALEGSDGYLQTSTQAAALTAKWSVGDLLVLQPQTLSGDKKSAYEKNLQEMIKGSLLLTPKILAENLLRSIAPLSDQINGVKPLSVLAFHRLQ